MTIKEIKDLAKLLKEEDAEKIKKEIAEKERFLAGTDLDEEDLNRVLNALFSMMVIEKTLETNVEDIQDIKDELNEELEASKKFYDSYMERYKKEGRKKKKHWLLNFLFLSDFMHNKREATKDCNVQLAKMKRELEDLKNQKSDENLKKITKDENRRNDFLMLPYRHPHPFDLYFEHKSMEQNQDVFEEFLGPNSVNFELGERFSFKIDEKFGKIGKEPPVKKEEMEPVKDITQDRPQSQRSFKQ